MEKERFNQFFEEKTDHLTLVAHVKIVMGKSKENNGPNFNKWLCKILDKPVCTKIHQGKSYLSGYIFKKQSNIYLLNMAFKLAGFENKKSDEYIYTNNLLEYLYDH